MPEELSYATTKGALETFTRTLAAAVAGKGITVNAINPGPTDTGWMDAPLLTLLVKGISAPTGEFSRVQDQLQEVVRSWTLEPIPDNAFEIWEKTPRIDHGLVSP